MTSGKIRGLILRNQIITLLKYYIPENYITREQIESHVPDPEEDWKLLLPEEAFAVSLSVGSLSYIVLLYGSGIVYSVVCINECMHKG